MSIKGNIRNDETFITLDGVITADKDKIVQVRNKQGKVFQRHIKNGAEEKTKAGKISINEFDKTIDAETKAWKDGENTEFYKEFKSYPQETVNKVKAIREKAGCPSVAVLRAYNEAKQYNTDKLILDNFWASDVENIQKTLDTGKINKFYLADSSTQLMDSIFAFTNKGWKMKPVEIPHPYHTTYDINTHQEVPKITKTLQFYR